MAKFVIGDEGTAAPADAVSDKVGILGTVYL